MREPLDEGESEEAGLKLNIQKMKIIFWGILGHLGHFGASSPITSQQIDGETTETVTDFIWGAPKSLRW